MQQPAVSDSQRHRLAATLDVAGVLVVRLVCALGMVNAAVMVVVSALAGRPALAVAAAIGWLWVWWRLGARAAAVRDLVGRRPLLLMVGGAAAMVPVALGGGLHGTLTTQGVWLTWLAAVTLGTAATLGVAVTMAAATAVALVAAGLPLDELAHGPDRFQATLLILDPVGGALMALALVRVFRVTLAGAGDTLAAIRMGGQASTPAMSALLSGRTLRLLEAPRAEALTDAERAVVDLLAEGLAAKQIALRRGTSVATVRAQIKHAKRKTGARTLNELVRHT